MVLAMKHLSSGGPPPTTKPPFTTNPPGSPPPFLYNATRVKNRPIFFAPQTPLNDGWRPSKDGGFGLSRRLAAAVIFDVAAGNVSPYFSSSVNHPVELWSSINMSFSICGVTRDNQRVVWWLKSHFGHNSIFFWNIVPAIFEILLSLPSVHTLHPH